MSGSASRSQSRRLLKRRLMLLMLQLSVYFTRFEMGAIVATVVADKARSSSARLASLNTVASAVLFERHPLSGSSVSYGPKVLSSGFRRAADVSNVRPGSHRRQAVGPGPLQAFGGLLELTHRSRRRRQRLLASVPFRPSQS